MLTEKRIRDAKPGPKTVILWDRQVKGLGLRIAKGGTKAFILDYRNAAGQRRRAVLARAAKISLAEARQRAARELASTRDGATDLLQRRQESRDAPTFADGVDQVPERVLPAPCRRWAHVAPDGLRLSQANRPVPDADARQNEDQGYLPRGHRARRRAPLPGAAQPHHRARQPTLQHVRGMGASRPEQQTRPSESKRHAKNRGTGCSIRPNWRRWRRRWTILRPNTLPRSPQSASRLSPGCASARCGRSVGSISASRQAGSPCRRPRPAAGRMTCRQRRWEILAARPRINEWAFTIGRAAPVTYRYCGETFRKAARRAGLDDVRLHDLRRTVMTSAAAAGIGVHVLRDLLGHRTTAMADRYVRHVGNPVREAREAIGAQMAAMMAGGDGAEIIPLRQNGPRK